MVCCTANPHNDHNLQPWKFTSACSSLFIDYDKVHGSTTCVCVNAGETQLKSYLGRTFGFPTCRQCVAHSTFGGQGFSMNCESAASSSAAPSAGSVPCAQGLKVTSGHDDWEADHKDRPPILSAQRNHGRGRRCTPCQTRRSEGACGALPI